MSATSTSTPTQMPRAERRRLERLAKKNARRKSRDLTTYLPEPYTPVTINPDTKKPVAHTPFTPEELLQRAIFRKKFGKTLSAEELRHRASIRTKKTSLIRPKARITARKLYRLGLLKNKELGIDPKYMGKDNRAWRTRAKLWDRAHSRAPEAEVGIADVL